MPTREELAALIAKGLKNREMAAHLGVAVSKFEGDRMTAVQWLEAQRVAIKSRSPGQVARMEQEKGLA